MVEGGEVCVVHFQMCHSEVTARLHCPCRIFSSFHPSSCYGRDRHPCGCGRFVGHQPDFVARGAGPGVPAGGMSVYMSMDVGRFD